MRSAVPVPRADQKAKPLVPRRIGEVHALGSVTHGRLEDVRCRGGTRGMCHRLSTRRKAVFSCTPASDKRKSSSPSMPSGLTASPARRRAISASAMGSYRVTVANRRRILFITFGNKAKDPDTIAPDGSQEIESTGAGGLALARRNCFAHRAVIGKQPLEDGVNPVACPLPIGKRESHGEMAKDRLRIQPSRIITETGGAPLAARLYTPIRVLAR